jgi:RNA polymerase sigma factor (sigma-70 family)
MPGARCMLPAPPLEPSLDKERDVTTNEETDERDEDEVSTQTIGDEVERVLVAQRAKFLAFLERRVGSRERAEEILQEAFARGLDKRASLRAEESATAWFYRLLRNALVDQARRRDAERRALERAAHEPPAEDERPDAALMDTVCRCVSELVDTLKPEYADAVRRIELGGTALRDFAAGAGISPNNAAVRLHRAREALRRQVAATCGACATHGCRDCGCHRARRPAE